jgi:ATP-dependent RNA helicase RhlE
LTSFQNFGLAEPITRALAQENYTIPTPIQRDAIPLVMAGRDLIGIAQTGTGKTAAFALPILDRLAANPQQHEKKTCRVLVLSPTRELSGQILESFRTYGRHLRISSALAIGGVSMGGQVRALMHGVDVLVATPGRLLDLVRGNALRLNRVDTFVLDEADRMLDMGFIHDIRTVITKLPKERQTLFFSATMPREVAALAADMLRNPARVAVTPVASTAERVTQRIIHTDRAAKPALLAEVLRTETVDRALVFTRTKHGADKVVRSLAGAGIAAQAIHGNKSQNQRERVLKDFRSGHVRTLIATDIAARGIDVDGISHVIPSTDRRSGRAAAQPAKARTAQPARGNAAQAPKTGGGQAQEQKHSSKGAKARNRSRQQRRDRRDQHGVKADRPVVAAAGNSGGSEIGSVRFMQGAPAREAQAPHGPGERGPVRYAAGSRSAPGPRY